MRKIILLSLIVLFIFISNAGAQLTFNSAFAVSNTFNEQGSSMTADANGNYFCAGYYFYWVDMDPGAVTQLIYSNGLNDGYVAKYTSDGELAWAFTLGGFSDDRVTDIKTDAANNIYVVGMFSDTVDFDPGSGVAERITNGALDVFLAKYDNNGNFLWVNTFGGNLIDNMTGVTTDAVNGSVIITGNYVSHSIDMDPGGDTHSVTNLGTQGFASDNIFLASYNGNDGSYRWAFSIGGAKFDRAGDITSDKDGNIYLGGELGSSNVDFDPGTATSYLSSVGSLDAFVAKYSSDGSYKWAKKMGSTGGDRAFSIATDNSGNVYLGGYFNSDSVDFDPGAGVKYLYSNGVQDLFLEKFDSSGKYKWAFSAGGLGSEAAQDIAISGQYIFITGDYGDSVDFDPGPGKHFLHGADFTDQDGYLAEYDTAGNFIDAIPFSGEGNEFGIGVCTISNNRVGVTGFFSSDTLDMDPGAAKHELYNLGGNPIYSDGFIAVYSIDGSSGISKTVNSTSFDIFPNPGDGNFKILFDDNTGEANIEVMNLLAEIVLTKTIKMHGGRSIVPLDITGVAGGMYIVKMYINDKVYTEKIIVRRQ